jgi:hypothetical protein
MRCASEGVGKAVEDSELKHILLRVHLEVRHYDDAKQGKETIAPYGVLSNAHKLNFPRCSKYCMTRKGTILSPWSTGSGTLPTSDASASFTAPCSTVTFTAEKTYGGASTSKL